MNRETFVEALLKELRRNIEVHMNYRSMGTDGEISAAVIEQKINSAQRALINDNVVDMLRVLEQLRQTER